MNIQRILILVKKSTYEHYFSPSGQKTPAKVRSKLSLDVKRRFKRTHDLHYHTLMKVEEALTRLQLPYQRYYRGVDIDYSLYDFVITIGGDGTLLEASHHVTTQTILGVNSNPQWSVGKFCVGHEGNFLPLMLHCLHKKAKVVALNRLQVNLKSHLAPVVVLNDVLACSQNPAAMSRYILKIKGREEEQRSSGIWLATAAGSTGAIQSAGGKDLPLLSRKFQYRPRELYKGWGVRYHLLGGVFSSTDQMKMTSLMGDGCVYVDGSHVRLPFPIGETLTVQASPFPLKIVWT